MLSEARDGAKGEQMTIWMVIRVVLGSCVTIQYAYWAAMYAGAWMNWNTPPVVSLDWLALGMFGAMFASGDWVLNALKSLRGGQ